MSVRAWIIGLAMLGLCPGLASAGLIFDLDGRIDGHRVQAAELTADRLAVSSQGHIHVIRLPAGTGAYLMDWAQRDTGGPLVFSIDDSLVATDDLREWLMQKRKSSPPSVPAELANLIFHYDDYAHSVACGATPQITQKHPLVALAGERMLPAQLHRTLLDPVTRSSQAYAYRRLAERFVAPPVCVGELTLYATPGGHDQLVALQPRSWVSMITYQWYRTADVPSEGDEWIASLPYLPLRQDIEKRWTEYRAAFPPLAALSSIVEAMAVLRAIKRDAPAVWQRVERGALLPQPLAPARIIPLKAPALDPLPWRALVYAWIGQWVETPAEANLAIGLAVDGEDPRVLAIDGLTEVAARDPVIDAKLQLAHLILDREVEQDPVEIVRHLERLFDTLSASPQAFRLRAMALTGVVAMVVQRRLPWDRGIVQLLVKQGAALADDFLQRAEFACAARSSDLVIWESLTQDVYSVNLFKYLKQGQWLPARAASAIACIHFHRGMALQRGRELAYRHAHYRFLQYLSQNTDDIPTQRQIAQYRSVMAESMNLHDRDEP